MQTTSSKRRNGHITMSPMDPRRRRRPRRVWGSAPDASYRPLTLAEFDTSFVDPGDAPSQRWRLDVLCARCMTSQLTDTGAASEGWLSLKLYATSEVRLKANFWLGWAPRAMRFAQRGDHSALRTLRPDLYEALTGFLTIICTAYRLTAGHYSRVGTRIGGVDQSVLCPYRGITTVSRRRRDGGGCAYALIRSEGQSIRPLRAADMLPGFELLDDVSDLL